MKNMFPGEHVLPGHIEAMLRVCNQTNAEEDRLLALRAANSFDKRVGMNTGYSVVAHFMEQQGRVFRASEPLPEGQHSYSLSTETPRVAIATQAVAQAMGDILGVETVIQQVLNEEELDAASQIAFCVGTLLNSQEKTKKLLQTTEAQTVTVYGSDEVKVGSLVSDLPEEIFEIEPHFAWSFPEGRPYFIHNRGVGTQSMNNFQTAVGALLAPATVES